MPQPSASDADCCAKAARQTHSSIPLVMETDGGPLLDSRCGLVLWRPTPCTPCCSSSPPLPVRGPQLGLPAQRRAGRHRQPPPARSAGRGGDAGRVQVRCRPAAPPPLPEREVAVRVVAHAPPHAPLTAPAPHAAGPGASASTPRWRGWRPSAAACSSWGACRTCSPCCSTCPSPGSTPGGQHCQQAGSAAACQPLAAWCAPSCWCAAC